ncbi:hypothetical protein [Pontibacter liquoris]|uniref:hypothetical protein n=1 Tax=Pontibacter liquoris TaxID=2905677 RepID=UPI001FA75ACF|nr:hypothetical protein [Pontibacter liquoris]
MQRFILVFLLACLSAPAFAQETGDPASRLSFNVGAAWPLNEFNSKDYDDAYPAFAKNGALLQLSYTHTLKNRVALGATAAWRSNKFDMDRFVMPEDELVLSKESTPWRSLFLLADVQYQVPAKDGYFYVKGSVGAAYSRSAFLDINTPFGHVTRTADNSMAPAYGLSTGVHVNLRQFGLGLETGLLATKPEFEIENAQGEVTKYKQPMTTMHLSLLVSYAF